MHICSFAYERNIFGRFKIYSRTFTFCITNAIMMMLLEFGLVQNGFYTNSWMYTVTKLNPSRSPTPLAKPLRPSQTLHFSKEMTLIARIGFLLGVIKKLQTSINTYIGLVASLHQKRAFLGGKLRKYALRERALINALTEFVLYIMKDYESPNIQQYLQENVSRKSLTI